jgi:translation initiation factor 1
MVTDRLGYSTERGRVAPARDAGAAPRPTPAAPRIPDDGTVRIFRERAGRRGKVVTVIRGLRERGAALERLAAELRRASGAGGTVRKDTVEIQGDHRERIAARLSALGYHVKLAGGSAS